MHSPYGLLVELEEELEEWERLPYGSSVNCSPQFYGKEHGTEFELVPHLLLEQTNHYTPGMYYDPVSEEIVSVERDRDVVDLKEVITGDCERPVDIDSLLWASAQRGLIGDSDTHAGQYGFGVNGEVYTFDYGLAGQPFAEIFRNEDFSHGDRLSAKKLREYTAVFIDELGLGSELVDEDNPDYHLIEQKVGSELKQRMSDLASQVEIEEFRADVRNHPHLDVSFPEEGIPRGYRLAQLVDNVKKLRSPGFDIEEALEESEHEKRINPVGKPHLVDTAAGHADQDRVKLNQIEAPEIGLDAKAQIHQIEDAVENYMGD